MLWYNLNAFIKYNLLTYPIIYFSSLKCSNNFLIESILFEHMINISKVELWILCQNWIISNNIQDLFLLGSSNLMSSLIFLLFFLGIKADSAFQLNTVDRLFRESNNIVIKVHKNRSMLIDPFLWEIELLWIHISSLERLQSDAGIVDCLVIADRDTALRDLEHELEVLLDSCKVSDDDVALVGSISPERIALLEDLFLGSSNWFEIDSDDGGIGEVEFGLLEEIFVDEALIGRGDDHTKTLVAFDLDVSRAIWEVNDGN